MGNEWPPCPESARLFPGPKESSIMAFDSDSLLKWFGIALIVLAVGYFLFRAGKVVWGSIGTFRKVYSVSMTPPSPPGFYFSFVDTRTPDRVPAKRVEPA
jgi:hypothetical protein